MNASAEPLPPQLRSAGVTEAQWRDAETVIHAQATSLRLRDDALRTLAIEIFQAQPGESSERYLALIRAGAATLPHAIQTARSLDPQDDPTLTSLKERIVAAVESGQLREALGLQDQYTDVLRRSVEQTVEAAQRRVADAYSAGAALAWARGDYFAAAGRFKEAADFLRGQRFWEFTYRASQAMALRTQGRSQREAGALRQAISVWRDQVLILAEARPNLDHERVELGIAYMLLWENSAGAERAEAFQHAYDIFAEVIDYTHDANLHLDADPYAWMRAQIALADLYRVSGAPQRAATHYELALNAQGLGGSVVYLERGTAYFGLAQCEQALGRIEEARRDAQRATDMLVRATPQRLQEDDIQPDSLRRDAERLLASPDSDGGQ